MKYLILFLLSFNVYAQKFKKAICLADAQNISREGFEDSQIFVVGDVNMPKDFIFNNGTETKIISAKKHLAIVDNGACDVLEAAYISEKQQKKLERENRKVEVKNNIISNLESGQDLTKEQLRKVLIFLLKEVDGL